MMRPVNASTQTPPPEPSDDRFFYAFVGFWVLMCVGYILFCWLVIAIVILLVAPWVSLLHGGLGTHSSFHWAVSPGPGSLAWRGGACATVMLALIFNPWGWIQHTRNFLRGRGSEDGAGSAGDSDARVHSETHPGTESEEIADRTEDQAHAGTQSVESNARVLALTTGSFLVLLIGLIGIFAGTDMQAAHDHLHGAAQCFSVGLQQPGHSVRGKLRAWDALYFTTGNLTTAGTGLIAPLSTSCRAITTVQTAIGSIVILLGIGGLVTRLLESPLVASGQRSRRL
jgi:hypothetical protein